jgi:hypothetical protein
VSHVWRKAATTRPRPVFCDQGGKHAGSHWTTQGSSVPSHFKAPDAAPGALVASRHRSGLNRASPHAPFVLGSTPVVGNQIVRLASFPGEKYDVFHFPFKACPFLRYICPLDFLLGYYQMPISKMISALKEEFNLSECSTLKSDTVWRIRGQG